MYYSYMDAGDYIDQTPVTVKPRRFYFLGLAIFIILAALLGIGSFLALAL